MEKYFKVKKYPVEKKETGFIRWILVLIFVPIFCALMHLFVYYFIGEIVQWIWMDVVFAGVLIYGMNHYFRMIKVRKKINSVLPDYVAEIFEGRDFVRFYSGKNDFREVNFVDIKNVLLVVGARGDSERYKYEFPADKYCELFVELKDGKVWKFKPIESGEEEMERFLKKINLKSGNA